MIKRLLPALLLSSSFCFASYDVPNSDVAKPVNIRAYLMSVAAFSEVEYAGVVPFTVNFAEKGDIPSGLQVLSYDYGDGFSGRESSHIYSVPGDYIAKMTLVDRIGREFVAEFSITAKKDPKECRYSNEHDAPSAYVKHYSAGDGLFMNDFYWDGQHVGRSHGMGAVLFNGFVYKPGEFKGQELSVQEVYSICREPEWRYTK